MRAVLDANVIISGVLARDGAPARVLAAWREGAFELIVSQALLAELARAFSYPRLRKRIDPQDAASLLDWPARLAILAEDVETAPARSADAADDYLIALAADNDALLVSGDKHLLALADQLPILPPARFLELVDSN
ncbi:MAG TPA: putative toxin-antitoxin system toxin component, PIN family [Solirubrobacteraceae bacterium]|nr:putative toxin-antitoxin system toxin component, PIN family [Solirubrobacteraceae bacterium]